MAKGTVTERMVAAQPRVRRGYFECRYGQLHVYNSIPAGGGFDEATSLICLHNFPFSARVFLRLLPLTGRDRSTYAPDLPGFGASDPPATRPAIADYAAGIADFCDTMRFRQVDVLGYQGGSLVAAELAIARPSVVRRVALLGVPLPAEAEREAFRRAPWPAPPQEDGSHLLNEWGRSLEARSSGVSLEAVARSFADKIGNGPNACWGLSAALAYASRERLGLITQPVLMLRSKDALWESTLRARELTPRARLVDLPDLGAEPLERAPEVVANALKEFLRG
jgi:pimeloyl-ACP methyl ester carboxylesterase